MIPLNLKPLQNYMLDQTREAFRRSRRVILQAATGSGKTIIAAQIVKNALERGKKVIFIADRIVLCNQTSNVFLKYGIPHGVIQAGNRRFDISQPVQICSIQTLNKRGCPDADLIIIDEAHVLYQGHIEIMNGNPDAFVLGLTASPYTKGLGKYFDFHIEPVPIKKLTEENYLVPYEIYGPSIADLSKLKVVAGEFTEESLSEVYDKKDIVGDVVKTWQRLANGKKTIVFGVNVAHIKHIVEQFHLVGISACQVNAYETDERDEVLDSFINGDVKILCSVEVATKGFDCPKVECAVLAVATKSMIKWTQTVGRALRTYGKKEKAIILDLGGNAERLGFPDDFKFTRLDDGKKPKNSEIEAKTKLPQTCPSCDYVKPIGVRKCPACGFTPERKPEVEAADGEIVKLQRKAKKEYNLQEKQSFLAQLNQYAFEQKYKRGFAIHAYVDKFGCEPASRMDWWKREPVGKEVLNYTIHKQIKYANRRIL